MEGSLTVEVALVLPIFIYVVIAFIYFLQILRLQECLQNAITETGLFTAKYAYVYDYVREYGKGNSNNNTDNEERSSDENKDSHSISSIEAVIAKSINSSYYKLKIQDYLDVNFIDQFCVKNGFNGISTHLSSFLEEDAAVDIVLRYDIKLPLQFLHMKDIPVLQRVRLRGWIGHKVALKSGTPDSSDQTEGDERIVYITETGTVYHYYRDCSHLDLSVHEVNINQIHTLRNEGGGKYTPCDLCKDSVFEETQSVYITDYGDRYHYSLTCSGLKRTIITISISQVGDRSLCSRCSAR